MKTKNLLLFFIVSGILVLLGCNKNDTEPNNQMDSMIAPEGFTFETTYEVEVSITMPGALNFENLRSRFDIYTDLPENGGKLISSGSFDENGEFNGIIRIPTNLTEITVSTIAGIITIPIENSTYKKWWSYY